MITLNVCDKLYAQTCHIMGSPAVCAPMVETYQVTPMGIPDPTYAWSIDGGGTITAGQNDEAVTIRWTMTGSHVVTCVISSGGSPAAVCTLPVDVSREIGRLSIVLPDVISSLEEGSIVCVGGTFQAGLSQELPDDAIVTWSYEGGTITGDVDGATYSPSASGTSQLCTDIVWNGGACMQQLCVDIEAIDLTTPPVITSSPPAEGDLISVCRDQQVFFSSNYDGATLVWQVAYQGQNYTYYGDELSFEFGTPGTYQVEVSPLGGERCGATPSTVNVEVAEQPGIQILCPSPVCNDDQAIYEATGDCAQYIWSIDPSVGEIITSTNNIVSVRWHNDAGLRHGALAVTGIGCDGLCELPVTTLVPLFPPADMIEGPESLCGDQIALYSLPYWEGVSYSWTTDASNSDVRLIPDGHQVTMMARGDFSGVVMLSVTASQQGVECEYIDDIEVTIYRDDINLDGPYCEGEDIALSLTNQIGMPVDWSVMDASGMVVYSEGMVTGTWMISGGTLTSGRYDVMAMLPGGNPGGCPISNTIEVNPQPDPPMIEGPQEVCPMEIYRYRVSGIGQVEWQIEGGSIIGDADVSVVEVNWGNTGPHRLEARVTRLGCQSDWGSIEVNVNATSTIDIIGPAQACADNLMPMAYTASFDGASSYQWSITPANVGSIVSGQGTSMIGVGWHQVTGVQSATMTLEYEVCGVVSSTTWMVDLTPMVPAILAPTSICANEAVTLTAMPADGMQYTWRIDGAVVSGATSASLDYTFPTAGQYNVAVDIIDGGGCAGVTTATAMVDVQPNPDPVITVEGMLPCPEGTPFSIDLTAQQGAGLSGSYQWYRGGVALPGTNTSGITVSQTGSYRVEVSYDNGCTATSNRVIDYDCPMMDEACEDCSPEVEVDIFSISFPSTECGKVRVRGDIIDFTDPRINAMRWVRGTEDGGRAVVDFNDDAGLTQNWTYTAPGVYPVSLQVDWVCDDGDLCTVRHDDVIRVPLVADFDYTLTCAASGDRYIMDVFDRSAALDVVSATTLYVEGAMQSSSLGYEIFPSSSPYDICWEVETVTGYTCQTCKMIDVPEPPDGDFEIGARGFCEGQLVQLTPIISNMDDVASISWDFGDGSTSELLQPMKAYGVGTSGLKDITLTIETIYGCTVSETQTVLVVRNRINGRVDVIYDDCGASADLNYRRLAGPQNLSYQWNPLPSNDPSITVMEDGVYEVEVTDPFGCTFTTSEVVVLDPAFRGAIGGERERCSGIALSIFGVDGFDYEWTVTPGGFNPVSGDRLELANVPAGSYTVTVEALSGGMTCGTLTTEVTVYGVPDPPSLTAEVVECNPQLVTLTADQEALWTGSGLPLSGITGSLIQVTRNGNYRARVTNEFGCSSLATISVEELVDLSGLPGQCNEYCLEEIQLEDASVMGPGGLFESWAWEVDGDVISSGTGAVADLVIRESYVDKPIRLTVMTATCGSSSMTFFIDATPCNDECEELEIQGAARHTLCQIGGGFDQLAIDVSLFFDTRVLPSGYFDCGFDPVLQNVITTGAFSDQWTRDGGYLEYNNVIIIEDPELFQMNGGVYADWTICNEAGLECPVTIFFPFQMSTLNMCEEGDQLMCPNIRMCNTGYTIDKEETTRSERICLTLPFVTGGECHIEYYDITVSIVIDGQPVNVIFTERITPTTIPGVVEVCEWLDVPLALLDEIDGLLIEITSDCAGACTLLYPIGQIKTGWCETNLVYKVSKGGKAGERTSGAPSTTGLTIYPVPASTEVMVELGKTYDLLEIYSSEGRRMLQILIDPHAKVQKVDVSDYGSGIYFMRAIADDGVETSTFEVMR